jgi:hypothetical protein
MLGAAWFWALDDLGWLNQDEPHWPGHPTLWSAVVWGLPILALAAGIWVVLGNRRNTLRLAVGASVAETLLSLILVWAIECRTHVLFGFWITLVGSVFLACGTLSWVLQPKSWVDSDEA